jgi:hypothetical protein
MRICKTQRHNTAASICTPEASRELFFSLKGWNKLAQGNALGLTYV